MEKGKGAFVADVQINFQEGWRVEWDWQVKDYAKASEI